MSGLDPRWTHSATVVLPISDDDDFDPRGLEQRLEHALEGSAVGVWDGHGSGFGNYEIHFWGTDLLGPCLRELLLAYGMGELEVLFHPLIDPRFDALEWDVKVVGDDTFVWERKPRPEVMQ